MHIVIIGNGISGTTAARYIRKKSDCRITMVSEEGKYPFSRTALMYIYMGHLKYEHTKLYEDDFWIKNRIELLHKRVNNVDTALKCLKFADGSSLTYDKLILATGSKPKTFEWFDQDCTGVHGLYHTQDLNAMEYASAQGIQKAVIVGGGLIGIEMAEMFHSRNIAVTILVREKNYLGNILPEVESIMINDHIRNHGIDLKLQTELAEIRHHDNKVTSILTKSGDEIQCQYVGLTIGVIPNVNFLKTSGVSVNKGIVVNEYLQTSIADIYAAGDCVELSSPAQGRRAIEALWYTGRNMGQVVAQNVLGEQEKYVQGIWFNSAKFFDIEYQVYGQIPTSSVPELNEFLWQHSNKQKSLRIVFNLDAEVVGFNLMGIRFRQEVCEKWIKEKYNIDDVISHLSLANFDPEFYDTYENSIIELYNKEFNKNISPKSKRSLTLVKNFLNRIRK